MTLLRVTPMPSRALVSNVMVQAALAATLVGFPLSGHAIDPHRCLVPGGVACATATMGQKITVEPRIGQSPRFYLDPGSRITAQAQSVAGGRTTGMAPNTKNKGPGGALPVTVQDGLAGTKTIAATDPLGRTTTTSSFAKGTASLAFNANGLAIGTDSSFAQVVGNGPVGVGFSEILDPLAFADPGGSPIQGGTSFSFSNILLGVTQSDPDVMGMLVQAIPGSRTQAVVHTTVWRTFVDAATASVDKALLFDWTLSVRGVPDASGRSVSFMFESGDANPGLDDAAIMTQFANASRYDPTTGALWLPEDFTAIDFAITAPHSLASMQLDTDTRVIVRTTPEPQSVWLMLVAIVCGRFGVRRRGRLMCEVLRARVGLVCNPLFSCGIE